MDKIDKLLDAIEHPDRYSDQEIEGMFQDPETKEMLKLLDKTKSCMQQPTSTPDVDAEWERFRNAHRREKEQPRFKILNLINRNIAASITVVIASFAAVAAVVGVSVNYFSNQEVVAPPHEMATIAADMNASANTIAENEESVETVAPETVVFDNESLETIATKIAEYYGYDVEFNSEGAKSLRLFFIWNQALLIEDVVESLNNFEQIHLSLKGKTIKID